MLNKPIPPMVEGRLAVRAREAARLLSVSERTLWTWVATRGVPHIRLGGVKSTVLFRPEALARWLEEVETGGGGQGTKEATAT